VHVLAACGLPTAPTGLYEPFAVSVTDEPDSDGQGLPHVAATKGGVVAACGRLCRLTGRGLPKSTPFRRKIVG